MDLTLGQKVKNARMSKGMTQQDVVGSFISRNMLSKIENDSATPSMRTLEYLARVLEVPLGYLMASIIETPQEQSGIYGHQDGLSAVRDALRSADYDRCLDELNKLPSNISKADECHFIYALVYAYFAKKAQTAGDLPTAAENAANALESNAYGLYDDRALEAEMLLTLVECDDNAAENLQTALKLPLLNELPARCAILKIQDHLRRHELTQAEKLLEKWQESISAIALLKLRAEILMGQNKYADALKLLQEAETQGGDSMLYKHIEECAREMGDFALAYQYAAKRLQVFEK